MLFFKVICFITYFARFLPLGSCPKSFALILFERPKRAFGLYFRYVTRNNRCWFGIPLACEETAYDFALRKRNYEEGKKFYLFSKNIFEEGKKHAFHLAVAKISIHLQNKEISIPSF